MLSEQRGCRMMIGGSRTPDTFRARPRLGLPQGALLSAYIACHVTSVAIPEKSGACIK